MSFLIIFYTLNAIIVYVSTCHVHNNYLFTLALVILQQNVAPGLAIVGNRSVNTYKGVGIHDGQSLEGVICIHFFAIVSVYMHVLESDVVSSIYECV